MNQSEILRQITNLEAERQRLWDATNRRTLTAGEISRLITIRGDLDRLWSQRRAEKSGSLAGVIVSEQTSEGRGHRGQYRTTRDERELLEWAR
jgi:hypothetical protein